MLIDNLFPFWIVAIIIVIMLGILYGTGAALLGASALLFGASFQQNVQQVLLLRIVSGILFASSVYLFIEALRLGYWRDHYYHPSDDTAIKPPPDLLIIKFIRWLKGHQYKC